MPAVAIVGRKNVGKSTIFNRLTGMRYSIVYKEPGVTRDRVYGEVEWCGRSFGLIDTGGFFPNEDFPLAKSIQDQIEAALEEADIIYFVVDGRSGLKPIDGEISSELRKVNKPIFLLVNKIDSGKIRNNAAEFYGLGHERMFVVSAEAGVGFGDVLDATLEQFPAPTISEKTSRVRLLIMGRPNSGKSTLLNAFLGKERAIVDVKPGTTRDLVNARITFNGKGVEIIDTAGIRKRSRIKEPIEFYSVMRAIRTIEQTDVTILIFDTTTGIVDQDRRIAALVLSEAKGLIVAPNKIDLIEPHQQKNIVPSTIRSMPYLDFVPVIPISAKNRKNVAALMQKVMDVHEESSKIAPQKALDDISRVLKPPPKGEIFKLRQIGHRPPVFQATLSSPAKESYIQYLRHVIRNYLGFSGIPVLIKTKVRKKIRRR
ncbi:MAG: ribosome biogenesis GTPase Der [candidate division WOR-3 bacterium]|nr:MAG: ribosome biogenesis GTPase Der [candidate division WOR-3 bacterium]